MGEVLPKITSANLIVKNYYYDNLLFQKTWISTCVILVHQVQKCLYLQSHNAPNVLRKLKTIVPFLGQIFECRKCSKI